MFGIFTRRVKVSEWHNELFTRSKISSELSLDYQDLIQDDSWRIQQTQSA